MTVPPLFRDRMITAVCHLLAWLWDRVPFSERSLPAAPRVLILKPCCLGDVLMATPAIATLRSQWPAAQIDFAVGPWSRPMVEHNPHLDHLLDCGPVGSGSYRLRDWVALIRQVRAGSYHLCMVLDRSPLISLVPALAGVPQRVGLDSNGRGFSLTHRISVSGIQHEVDLYLACVQAVGIPTDNARSQFFPTPAAEERVGRLLDGLYESLAVVHPAGGVNPGMTLSAKRWPIGRYAVLVRRLCGEKGMRVFVAGGPNDRELAEEICRSVPERDQVVNVAGELSLDELGALLERANLFVGNDTGAMHLAVAAGTPTVAIFGPSDPRQYGPYGSSHRVVWKPPACAPCLERGRWNQACRDFKCIEIISVDDVWSAVLDVLP